MDHYDEISETQTHEIGPRIVEYPDLVSQVQLSVARLIDVPGAIEARTFSEVLAQHDESDHEGIIGAIGTRFDDALVDFVVGSLSGRRHQEMVILAESSEGIDGHLFWEPRLMARVALLKSHGLLQGSDVRIERYSTEDQVPDALTPETVPEYHHA